MANLKEAIHAHTPSGRYEQYRAKNDYLLDQTQGEARYLLEKRLDHDAKTYATKKFAGEVITTAVLATGAFFLGREIQRKELKNDIQKIRMAIITGPTKLKQGFDLFLHGVGEQVGDGVIDSVQAKAPDIISGFEPAARKLGETIASSAVSGMSEGIDGILKTLKTKIDVIFAETQLKILTALFGKSGKGA